MNDASSDSNSEAALAAMKSDADRWKNFENKHSKRYEIKDPILIEGDLRGLNLLELSFNKPIKFSGCNFNTWPFAQCFNNESMTFIDCTFEELANNEKSVDERIFQIKFNPEYQKFNPKRGALEFYNCTFDSVVEYLTTEQSLILQDCTIKKGFRFIHRVKGSVAINGNAKIFHGPLIGKGITFCQDLTIDGFKIESATNDQLKISGVADFENAIFEKKVAFTNINFTDEVNFSGAKFHTTTNFKDTVFQIAPKFHGAELDPETIFDPIDRFDKQFPDTKSNTAEKRYQTLKGLFGQKQALSEQLGFARLEMKSHAHKTSYYSLHNIYGAISDYGLSWLTPAGWLLYLSILYTCFYIFCLSDCRSFFQGFLYSLSNTVPFFGGIKEFRMDNARLFNANFKYGVTAITIIQSITSGIMIFLIGLGIRNRLRMK